MVMFAANQSVLDHERKDTVKNAEENWFYGIWQHMICVKQ